MEFEEGVRYRMAYGEAYRLAEARRYDMQYSRDRASPAAGGDLETVYREVCARLRIEDRAWRELARGACEDALEGRQPRW